MKLYNLYNLAQKTEPMHSLLTANRVKAGLGIANDSALAAWLKSAQIGEWFTINHPVSDQLKVKRIQ